jgi:hypothetical protein
VHRNRHLAWTVPSTKGVERVRVPPWSIRLSVPIFAAWTNEDSPTDSSGCQRRVPKPLPGGSDGDRLPVIDTTRPIRIPLPDLRPDSVRCGTSPTSARRHSVQRTTVRPEQWPEIAVVVKQSGLRVAAQHFGVSHEAIRKAIRQRGVATDLESRHADRDQRVRELALQGVPWAKIADEVGLSTWRVRSLCADLPRRQGGRPERATDRAECRYPAD